MYLSTSTSNIIYFVRRSSANPGTRYISRGLDDHGNPGNEVECDLCFIRENAFYVNTWYRGSVPIKWSTKQGFLGASHRVEEICHPQTHKYFSKISANNGSVPVVIISLLDQNEDELQKSYELSIQGIDHPQIQFYKYDVNKMMKRFQDKELVEDISRFLHQIDSDTGFRTFKTQQRTILRFNCVDSLDRTNIATFAHARNLAIMMGASDDEMAFIARSFIYAGDSISIMYSGTDAIKKSSIRSFTNDNYGVSFDTPTSILRYFVNFFGSPQSIIEEWTAKNIQQKFISTIIDPLHLSIVPSIDDCLNSKKTLSSALLGEMLDVETNSLEETSNSLIISLPSPMQFTAILMLLTPAVDDYLPPSQISIKTGNNLDEMYLWMNAISLPRVNSPTWIKFDLMECDLWNASIPYERCAADFCRFIRIDFEVSEKFCLGNIKIVCMDDDEYSVTHTCDNFHKTHPRVMKSYSNKLDEIQSGTIQSSIDIVDILDLEIQRLSTKIPLHERNLLLIKKGLNPACYEPLSMFSSNDSSCSLCKDCKSMESGGIVYSSRTYPSLINLDHEENNDEGVRPYVVCNGCLKKIFQKRNELMNLYTNIYNSFNPHKIIEEKPLKWYEKPMNESLIELSKKPSFIIQSPPGNPNADGLLYGYNDFLWTSKNESSSFSFNISLRGYSHVKRVSFVFSGENLPKSVLISRNEYPISNEMEEINLEVHCEFLIMTFLMQSECQLSLRSISAYGCYDNLPIMKAQCFKFQPLAFNASRKHEIFDFNSRAVKFPLSQPGRLRLVTFDFSQCIDTGYIMKSAFIVTTLNGKFVEGLHIILPQVLSDSALGYPFHSAQECDCVTVFFLDRCLKINIPSIMLNIGPPSGA
ncbi:hypothetical protein TVAG_305520 [Trichomonas vaginalis G3]|uniref:SAC domain-containing protein n=1 Tax=Trichomonas vaginalis (strain ATCC PRA-98 / G3) TaxID=412133 RepID=A2ERC6_TRIV3|nr:inositol monophosphate 3-phosphatase protein [Trichomonas vaginalis G3]EAY04802.1 hypothetical protein TVAG_305520 [Trichomonas vaginalis G3]KAI5491003.1 inositol monophosphate 3-phosphatase protein [Trichomonas vaginalis G3]|eukprot:XP_001317025.1 hypothetical protein [Trichomonas vaginalis G3]